MSANIVNHVILVSIYTKKIVSAKKKIVDKLVEWNSAEECTENINEVKITWMALFQHENEFVCSYTVSIVLTVI